MGLIVYAMLSQLTYSHKLAPIRKVQTTNAYEKQEKFHQAAALAKSLPKEIAEKPKPVALNAGQMKKVHLPLGKTLEESLQLWKTLRADTLSIPDLSQPDMHLVAKTTAQIHRTEAQIGLNQKAESEFLAAMRAEGQAQFAKVATQFSSPLEKTLYEHNRKFSAATNAYSYQVQLAMNGFKVAAPNYFEIA